MLRCNGSPGCYDSGLRVICIVGSGVSHLPLDNTTYIPLFLQTLGPWFLNEMQNVLSSEKRIVFSSLRSSLLLEHIFLPNFFLQSTLHLICFDTALLEQLPLSVMTLCDLPSLWRVSMIVLWTIAKSAVFPIAVVSNNKRYPEFILYGWSFIESQM